MAALRKLGLRLPICRSAQLAPFFPCVRPSLASRSMTFRNRRNRSSSAEASWTATPVTMARLARLTNSSVRLDQAIAFAQANRLFDTRSPGNSSQRAQESRSFAHRSSSGPVGSSRGWIIQARSRASKIPDSQSRSERAESLPSVRAQLGQRDPVHQIRRNPVASHPLDMGRAPTRGEPTKDLRVGHRLCWQVASRSSHSDPRLAENEPPVWDSEEFPIRCRS
jgi:hypothetical protein